MDLTCPQCNNILSLSSSRLVQDTCGHKKCRICLLQDEFECRLCLVQKTTVTKNFDNHRTVIRQNKFKPAAVQNETKSLKTIKNRTRKCVTIPNHISVVLGRPPLYKCNICMKSFRTKLYIKDHSYCTKEAKPILRCDKCSKEFISKYHLQTHILGHLDNKQHVCNICDKRFPQNSKLIQHKLIHSDVKRFVCQECGKMFKTKDYLHRHSVIHNSEKPFACKKCDAKFKDASNLNKHQRVHIKEKVHMCDECGKRFKSKYTLSCHRRIHTRLRPHKCNVCYKSFLNGKELHRHQLIHSDIKAYTCSLCSTSFRRRDNLQRHARNTHPGKKPVIKKQLKRKDIKPSVPQVPQENPNAIHVITAPPAPVTIKPEPVTCKQVPVINAPLKLAFKTTAFKSNYNIHSREYIEPPRIQTKPYDYEESVSICQKILQPSNSPPPPLRTIIKTLGNISEKDSNEICHKILAPIAPLVIPDTSYSIKHIKFKLPSKYINLSKKNILNDLNIIKPVDASNSGIDTNLTYAELKPLAPINGATSVIVNTNATYAQNEMHWRRRTLQNLEMNLKQEDNI